MKTYTIHAKLSTLHAGIAMQEDRRSGWQFRMGGGSRSKVVSLFRKNPAEISPRWHYFCEEVHPVPVADGIAFAKPNHDSNQILVFVDTQDQSSIYGVEQGVGNWWFDRQKSETRLTIDPERQVLLRATGPKDWYANQHDYRNVEWHDALVVMNVGDVIYAISPNKEEIWAKYESVEKGLVKL